MKLELNHMIVVRLGSGKIELANCKDNNTNRVGELHIIKKLNLGINSRFVEDLEKNILYKKCKIILEIEE